MFKEHKDIPSHASGRIQRWALALAGYEYTFTARSTTTHGNADALSRLPLTESIETPPVPPELILTLEQISESPITSDQIRSWTTKDRVLQQVVQFIQQGWPNHCSQTELKPYWARRTELHCFEGCIMWGTRILVPKEGRQKMIQELHMGHSGMARMKALARTVIWWPKIDEDIEEMVKACAECQMTRANPPVAPLNPLPWPSKPWSRLHMDFAGPFMNLMFLVVIDAGSKWIEVFPMHTSTSASTIEHLRSLFSQFGLPDIVATDNGSCFVSDEFEQFLSSNGISHWKSAPYHPSTSGLAEKAIQIVKHGLKKAGTGTLKAKLARLLFNYRITPHTTTGVSPAQLLMGRTLKSRFDLLKPNIAARVDQKQSQQKHAHDVHAVHRRFHEGDTVYARDFRQGRKWLTGTVVKYSGPVSYKIKTENGQIIRRHQDHLRKRAESSIMLSDDLTVEEQLPVNDNPLPPVRRNPQRHRRMPVKYKS